MIGRGPPAATGLQVFWFFFFFAISLSVVIVCYNLWWCRPCHTCSMTCPGLLNVMIVSSKVLLRSSYRSSRSEPMEENKGICQTC